MQLVPQPRDLLIEVGDLIEQQRPQLTNGVATVDAWVYDNYIQMHVRRMRMGDWARSQGLQPREAWQRMQRGTLPSSLRPVRMGRFWFVEIDDVSLRLKRVAYARVSSSDQRADLARQKLRLLEHAQREGWLLDAVIEEVGSL